MSTNEEENLSNEYMQKNFEDTTYKQKILSYDSFKDQINTHKG
jgi:N-acetylneuraminic acid mutarotase